MKFFHLPLTFKQAKRVDEKNFRYYVTPDGKKPPSITTILSKTKPIWSQKSIEDWKIREGEAAYHITSLSQIYGTLTHEAIEITLQNRLPKITSEMVNYHYSNLSRYLKNINQIAGIELRLYSKSLNVAGTADCIAEYNKKVSIIDYKTKRKPQKEEWMLDAFIQATAYSIMYEERSSIKVSQIVILVSVEHGATQEFIKDPNDYKDLLYSKLKMYEELMQFFTPLIN